MPSPRLYLAPEDWAQDKSRSGRVPLSPPQAHYIRTVLRLSAGARLTIFNAREGEWSAELADSSKTKRNTAELILRERVRAPHFARYDIWLLCSPLKRPRLVFAAEKACELGASALLLTRCAFTDAPPPALARLTATMTAAAQQCGRLDVPRLEGPRPFAEQLQDLPAQRTLVYCDEAADAQKIGFAEGADFRSTEWAVLIGPEGGFSEAERKMLAAHPQAYPATLSASILRAETAVAAALAILQFRLRGATKTARL